VCPFLHASGYSLWACSRARSSRRVDTATVRNTTTPRINAPTNRQPPNTAATGTSYCKAMLFARSCKRHVARQVESNMNKEPSQHRTWSFCALEWCVDTRRRTFAERTSLMSKPLIRFGKLNGELQYVSGSSFSKPACATLCERGIHQHALDDASDSNAHLSSQSSQSPFAFVWGRQQHE